MSESNPSQVPLPGSPRSTPEDDEPNPRLGSFKLLGSLKIPWTGGGALGSNKQTAPASSTAYRPQTDLQAITKNEEACKKPLEESERIDLGSATGTNSGTTLVAWINSIERNMINNGTDTLRTS